MLRERCTGYLLWRRLGAELGLGSWVIPLTQMFVASIPSAGVLWWVGSWGDWSGGSLLIQNWVAVIVGGSLAVMIYLGVCMGLGLNKSPKGMKT